MAKVQNPWNELFETEGEYNERWFEREHFVLERDREAIEAFNAALPERSSARIHLDLPPEPFIGNIHSAQVIILGAHPSVDPANAAVLQDEAWRKAYRKNLISGAEKGGFYYAKSADTLELPGAYSAFGVRRIEAEASEEGETQQAKGGALTPLLNDLTELNGEDARFNHASDAVRAKVASKLYKNLMFIDFFPYAVDRSRDIFAQESGAWLASQRYQFKLVKQVLKRAKQEKHPPLVIVSKRNAEWYEQVPKLQHKFGKKPKSLTLMQNPGMVLSQSALDAINGKGAYKAVLKRLNA